MTGFGAAYTERKRKNMEKLYFRKERFRIMLVGDPHCYDEDRTEEGRKRLKDYLALQNAALDASHPDLVVLMGDNAYGETREEVRQVLLRMTKPYADRGIPFTFVLGNHDLQVPDTTLEQLYRVYRELPGVLTAEPITEHGDFSFLVYDPETDTPALQLLCVYSGSSPGPGGYSYYDWVLPEQNEWILKTTEACAAKYGKTPAVLFQHIPVPEEFGLLDERSALCMAGSGVYGQNEQKGRFFTKKKGVEGYLGEAPCVPAFNSGEFETIKQTGSVFAAFFGHDHMNDFVGMTDGVILGQCKTASFNVYGDGLRQAVRLLDFDLKAPYQLKTRMLTYRELIGAKCDSLHGSIAVLHDRTSVKLELIAKIALGAAAAALPALAAKLIRRNRKKGAEPDAG